MTPESTAWQLLWRRQPDRRPHRGRRGRQSHTHRTAPLIRLARDREAQHARHKVARRDAVRVSSRVEVVPLVDLVDR
eukprot:CAMPEP_0185424660 /NCGR_PEP_ID=MMETSP1365-20130426/13383_1 /TAXON_ID=38817 /ORGANISM="Gephyrocapsa oceanica, Strain RCC1303" /LENGTH=76 /DNA_ID=CAMNT_0028028597 /DNA_START=41 /DNA_END=268 /DNA_ORIENTATION=+